MGVCVCVRVCVCVCVCARARALCVCGERGVVDITSYSVPQLSTTSTLHIFIK